MLPPHNTIYLYNLITLPHNITSQYRLISHLSYPPPPPSPVANSGWCAFHFAAHGGHLFYLQWLLDDLYAVPTQRARDKKNAVHIAVAAGHTDVVR